MDNTEIHYVTFDPDEIWDEMQYAYVEAGGDILLTPPSLPAAYNGVLDAVKSGRHTEQRIDESIRRILTLKEKYGMI